MEPGATDRVRTRCTCGVTLRVPGAALGRTVKCPKCNGTFVARPADEPDHVVNVAPSEDRPLPPAGRASASKAVSAAVPAGPSAGPLAACPLCGKPMNAGAVLCVGCGYDARTGRRLSTAAASGTLVARLARFLGPFMLGCVLSSAGALIGGVVWFLIAIAAACEIGWIAWGLGILAGGGMALGCRRHTVRAGTVAAAIAAVGILAAKAAVFGFVVYTVATGDTDDVSFLRLYVQQRLANEELDNRGVWDAKQRDAQWESAWESAGKRVAGMNEAQVRAHAQSIRERESQDVKQLAELGLLRSRLTFHEAEFQAERDGLAWDDPRRERLHERTERRFRSLAEPELREQTAKLDAWQKEGRWADGPYVRSRLIFSYVEDDLRADPPPGQEPEEDPEPRGWTIPAEVWRERYEQAVLDVDDLSVEDRVAELKRLELKEEDRGLRWRLVDHFTDLAAEQAGLAYEEVDARHAIQEEQRRKFEALSHDELSIETKALESWESEGKWSDAAYLQGHLTFALAERAVEQRREARPNGTDGEEYWNPSPEEWRELHRKAAAEVAAIPPDQHAQRIRDLDAERTRAADEWIARQEREAAGSVASSLVAAYFSSLLTPLNGIFFFLALSSAFRIASRGFGGK